MSVLKVRCPETGREVSTGIEIDPESFANLPDTLPVSNCPFCGLDHAWLKCDARFVQDQSRSEAPG
jgi:endogenous inhibitor of DNA gyrase (YacG/DUF329 family)